jgi:predicted dehydrogenase
MVGFNRRFAPFARAAKSFIKDRNGPLMAVYRVNAGSLPPNDWQHDLEQGSGRIIGECGHFVDTLCYFADGVPVQVFASSAGGKNQDRSENENAALTIRFTDGSVGTVLYTTDGSPSFSKERLELFADGSVAVIDDYRQIELCRAGSRRRRRSWLEQDKGHAAEIAAFIRAVRDGRPEVNPNEYFQTTLCTLLAVESMNSGQPRTVSVNLIEELPKEAEECLQ